MGIRSFYLGIPIPKWKSNISLTRSNDVIADLLAGLEVSGDEASRAEYRSHRVLFFRHDPTRPDRLWTRPDPTGPDLDKLWFPKSLTISGGFEQKMMEKDVVFTEIELISASMCHAI